MVRHAARLAKLRLATVSSRATQGRPVDGTAKLFAWHDSSRLAISIEQALAVTRGEPKSPGGTLQIKGLAGRRALVVQVTPLPAPAFSPWGAIENGAHILVQIVDPQASIDAQSERLRLLVGLIAAETRVAALLGGGLSFAEDAPGQRPHKM
jgi:hypothetical protein